MSLDSNSNCSSASTPIAWLDKPCVQHSIAEFLLMAAAGVVAAAVNECSPIAPSTRANACSPTIILLQVHI